MWHSTTISFAVLAILAIVGIALPSAAQGAMAKEILAELGFPANAEQQVLAGKLVKTTLKSTSDRELATALAFLVKLPTARLAEELHSGLLLTVDPNSKLHGALDGEGSVAQLESLELSSSQVKAYSNAKPGGQVNLSKSEIDTFQALSGKPAAQIEEQVRKSLVARYASYRARGLDGIAPYARGGGKQTAAAEDLKRASEAASVLKKHAPTFYEVLNGYPTGKAGVVENFNWQNYEAHGEPVLVLTHAFSMTEGDAIAACQRQFYVSGSYNAEQALAGLLPVNQGTLVVYVNRTSTDQVTGLGGRSKRAIGSRVLAAQLEDLFEKFQKAASK